MISSTSTNSYQFMSGGGEMGKLMRDHDWSSTVVGHPSTWPQHLQTTLALVLDSKFPMFVFWGEQCVGFYNDAYRHTLGNKGKHPSILGIPGKEAWPEVWHVVGPLITSVQQTGEAIWNEDQLIPIYRNGKIEDVYWTFSYSPIKDDEGEVSGILVTSIETTAKVRSLKQLEEAENRFRNNLIQAPVGILILKGEKFVVEFANAACLQLIDREEDDLVGKALFDSLPEIRGTLDKRLQEVWRTGSTHYGNGLEMSLKCQGCIEKAFFDFVYQPLKEVDGTISTVMIVVSEVTARVTAKSVLADSEKQFRNMVMLSPIPMTILSGTDLVIEVANDPMLKKLWRRNKGDVIGKKLLDIFPELHNQQYPALLRNVMKGEQRYSEDESVAFVQDEDGMRKLYLDLEYAPILEADGSVYGIAVTANDVTEKVISRKLIEESENRLSMAIALTRLGTWDYNPLTGEVAWSKECKDIYAIVEDTHIDFEVFLEHIYPEDKAFALASVQKAMDPQNKDVFDIVFRIIRFDQEKTVRWVRSQGKVYFNAVKQAERFIGTVLDITDTKRSEEEAAKMAAIIQSSDDAIIGKTLTGMVTSWNNAAERIFGYTAAEMLDQPISKLLPIDREDEEALIIERIEKNEHVDHFETKRVRKDGTLIDVSITISPIRDNAGAILGVSKIARDITLQKKVEQELQESEVRLRLAAEATKLATWDLDLRTGAIIHSPRLAEIFGYNPPTILSYTDIRKQIHDEDRTSIVEKAFEEAMIKGTYYYEARVVKANKTISWIRTQGKAILDKDGHPIRMIGTMMDITEQKNAIAALEDSRLRMDIAIEASELGTWELDLVTQTMVYSKRYLEIVGFNENDRPNYNELLENIYPEDVEKENEAMEQAFKTGILDSQLRLMTRNSNVLRWIRSKGKVFYDNTGVPMKIMGTIADITAQKLYENNLLESEEKFRLLADSMPQYIWTIDSMGDLSYSNRSVYDFSGLTPEQLIQGGCGWLQIVHPDDKEETMRKWQEAISMGKPLLQEHRFRRHDGEYRWQLSHAIPKKDSYGNIQMWVGASTDIDELKKHEQQKDDFIKMASHELKTPITTVKGYVQLLLKTHGGGGDTFLADSLSRIDKQILKLTKLISDLLDVTKIETGSLSLTKECFAISDVVLETAKDIGAAHSSHSVWIDQNADPVIYADRERISQVLSNLFTNAIKYSPKADKIAVTIDATDTDVLVAVKDSGIGIAIEDQGRIFERFFRSAGKDEKTFPGFGIGLFIVNEILSLHDGKIWVKSEKGKGATFYFTLPLQV